MRANRIAAGRNAWRNYQVPAATPETQYTCTYPCRGNSLASFALRYPCLGNRGKDRLARSQLPVLVLLCQDASTHTRLAGRKECTNANTGPLYAQPVRKSLAESGPATSSICSNTTAGIQRYE